MSDDAAETLAEAAAETAAATADIAASAEETAEAETTTAASESVAVAEAAVALAETTAAAAELDAAERIVRHDQELAEWRSQQEAITVEQGAQLSALTAAFQTFSAETAALLSSIQERLAAPEPMAAETETETEAEVLNPADEAGQPVAAAEQVEAAAERKLRRRWI